MNKGVVFTPRLITPTGAAPLRGEGLDAPTSLAGAALAWRDGVLVHAGPAAELPSDAGAWPVHHARGAVVPGFVDCHTHLPFVGWRSDEFEARLAGRTYRDLHSGRGGGIFRSARLLAEATDEDVLEFGRRMAAEMVAHGTTALELKTGYGLSLEGELRQARLARRLAGDIAQATSVTLLACHAVPEGIDREAWVRTVCEELIPAAAAEGLVDQVDVYVEDIAFTLQDLARVAEAARAKGLPLRCHADQLGPSGGAEGAVNLGARSADHLNHAGPEGVRALGRAAHTAAVLLPVSTLFLGGQPAPAADLRRSGAALALATDFNPGTSPCLSMPEVISVAASLYRLPPGAALGASTSNPAWVLGLSDRIGSLEVGKRADFVVLDSEDMAMLPYRPGHNPVVETWIGGERRYRRPDP